MSIEQYRLNSLAAPIGGPNGQAWAHVLGPAQDAECALIRIAGVCRSTVKAPDDALGPVIGSIYNRAQAPREQGAFSDPTGSGASGLTAYRRRLSGAIAFWESAPTTGALDPVNTGIASILRPYASDLQTDSKPPIVINAGPAGFAWSSEFVIVWQSPLAGDYTWDTSDVEGGAPVYDDGGLWDVEYVPADPYSYNSFGVADLDWVRRQVRLCKASTAYPVLLAVELLTPMQGAYSQTGALWDDASVWDASADVWDTADAPYVLLPLGHVWEEEALFYGGAASAWDAAAGEVWDSDGDAFEPPSGGW